jgi:hypothetical protein
LDLLDVLSAPRPQPPASQSVGWSVRGAVGADRMVWQEERSAKLRARSLSSSESCQTSSDSVGPAGQ